MHLQVNEHTHSLSGFQMYYKNTWRLCTGIYNTRQDTEHTELTYKRKIHQSTIIQVVTDAHTVPMFIPQSLADNRRLSCIDYRLTTRETTHTIGPFPDDRGTSLHFDCSASNLRDNNVRLPRCGALLVSCAFHGRC